MEKVNKTERYYFLFSVKAIQKHAKKTNNKLTNHQHIFIKLILQNHQGEILVKSSSWMPAELINNQIKCENYPLEFRLTNHEEQQANTIFFKALVKKGRKMNSKNDYIMQGMQSDSIDESFEQIGKCEINAGIYMDLFKQCKKNHFQEKTEISKHYNIQYDIYLHKNRQMLKQIVKGSSGEQNYVNAAFKKRPNQKKIRYVQISHDRQKSLKEEEFKNSVNKLKISALKKSGSKYIPVKMVYQDYSPNNSGYHLNKTSNRNGIKKSLVSPGAQKVRVEEYSRTLQDTQSKNKNIDTNLYKTGDKSQQQVKVSGSSLLFNFFAVLGFIISIFIGYEMMIPSKKI